MSVQRLSTEDEQKVTEEKNVKRLLVLKQGKDKLVADYKANAIAEEDDDSRHIILQNSSYKKIVDQVSDDQVHPHLFKKPTDYLKAVINK